MEQACVRVLTSRPAFVTPLFFMLAGSLLVGFSVILVAVWLEYHDSLVWSATAARYRHHLPADSSSDSRVYRYHKLRRRWRLVIHMLLAVCGGLMIAAGWAGPGRFWIAAWTAVAILMLCILVIAMGDALRTYHHRVRNLSERGSDRAGG